MSYLLSPVRFFFTHNLIATEDAYRDPSCMRGAPGNFRRKGDTTGWDITQDESDNGGRNAQERVYREFVWTQRSNLILVR